MSGQYFWDRDEEGEVFIPPSDDGVKRFNPMKVCLCVYKYELYASRVGRHADCVLKTSTVMYVSKRHVAGV